MTEEYDRGVQDQRLQAHDDHFGRINGSIKETADQLGLVKKELYEFRMDLQRLTDAVKANQLTVVSTAEAVEKERKSTAEAVEKQRTALQDSTDKKWSPLARMVGIISIIAGIAGIIAFFISFHH